MASFYSSHWVLTFLIFWPLVGAVATLLVRVDQAKRVALLVGTVEFLVSLPLFWTFDPGGPAMQNEAAIPWIPDWGIFYRLGLDGISLFMVLLTTLLLPLVVLGSWTYIEKREQSYYAMLLALTTGVVGVFVSMDMFLF